VKASCPRKVACKCSISFSFLTHNTWQVQNHYHWKVCYHGMYLEDPPIPFVACFPFFERKILQYFSFPVSDSVEDRGRGWYGERCRPTEERGDSGERERIRCRTAERSRVSWAKIMVCRSAIQRSVPHFLSLLVPAFLLSILSFSFTRSQSCPVHIYSLKLCFRKR